MHDDAVSTVSQGSARRRGRPRADQAGEVEARVLDVAARLFLSLGFDRTTFEGIADLAHAGKATLYARYQNKENLFKAVVDRNVAHSLERIAISLQEDDPRERLRLVGLRLAQEILVPDVIALMRITIAEAVRLPEMALATYRIGFGGCVQVVADALAERGYEPAAPAEVEASATRFVEQVMMPLQMHALYGVDLPALRRKAEDDIARAVDALFEASMRNGAARTNLDGTASRRGM